MPTTVTGSPLGIACVFSDGSAATFSLDGLPCPVLARDLLDGLADLVHPHGTVDTAGSVTHYVQSVRDMTRKLAARGFAGGAADLRRPLAAEYWLAATGPREACTRRMLQAIAGRLDPQVAELAAGRAYNPQRNHRALPPYPEEDWDRLAGACRTIAGESFAAHKRALDDAAGGQHPASGGWTPANLRWLLARTGPVSSAQFGDLLGCTGSAVQQRGGFTDAIRDLFPSHDVLIAYRLLFGVCSGIVPDGIDDLVTSDIDWAGDSVILLSYVKGRRSGESLNLPRPAVRLLEQWLSHSALLRSFASEDDRRRLWLGASLSHPGQHAVDTGSSGRAAIQRWTARHHVTGQDGRPLKIHRARIRTTYHAMRDKSAWAGRGRATIDPNHSPQVEGDHYLSAATPGQRQAMETIVEDAQHDLLRRASPPAVLDGEDAAALARGYPELVASLGLDDTVIAELAGGQRDVFTAACADQLSGLHGPAGKPCPARPWVCLLCPLAVFAPRHAPNLLRLKAFFSRQWQPAAQFMAVFGLYSQRVGQVLDRFDPALVASAAVGVSNRDGELPLRPEESTQ
ncbi:MAG TPA: hypothetical protein VMV92_04880 [Streptosporangiaceae bacterium]|nr:hypothetical protein [Streptosporangiaceae bacterium]